jgi:DNA replication protein DnaC
MGEPKTIGDIIGNSLPQQTHLKSDLCACGQPKKFDRGILFPKCEACWAEQARQEKIIAAQQRLESIRQAHKDKAAKLRGRLGRVIPPLFIEAHLRDLSDKLRGIILALPATKGLFLYGPAGVGKSHSMAAIARRYILARQSVGRIQWDRLCLEVRNTFGSNGSELRVLEKYTDCDKLLIEDIGTTTSIDKQESDFALRTLLLILDDRIENCKPTFITSNKSPEQIGKSFDSRIESRIYASCVIQAVSGNDKRRAK